jgi:rhamnogalacturonyl hydrolase YesR
MRIPMPRLAKDPKTAIWFFRWPLQGTLPSFHPAARNPAAWKLGRKMRFAVSSRQWSGIQ